MQVQRALATYGAPVRLRVTPIFGGVAMGPQIQALRQGVDIVVATPGRLIDHLQRRTVDLSAIEILTLDEADRMLDMGFLPALRRVMPALPRTRQTLLFSATLSADVVELAADFTREPQRVDVSDGQSRGADGDAPHAPGRARSKARAADARADAGARRPGARLLQDQARRRIASATTSSAPA